MERISHHTTALTQTFYKTSRRFEVVLQVLFDDGLAFSVSGGVPAGRVKRPALQINALQRLWIFSKSHRTDAFARAEKLFSGAHLQLAAEIVGDDRANI